MLPRLLMRLKSTIRVAAAWVPAPPDLSSSRGQFVKVNPRATTQRPDGPYQFLRAGPPRGERGMGDYRGMLTGINRRAPAKGGGFVPRDRETVPSAVLRGNAAQTA